MAEEKINDKGIKDETPSENVQEKDKAPENGDPGESNDVKDEKTEKSEKNDKKYKKENAELKKENVGLRASLADEKDRYLRMIAEYDNFRKRTVKERENVYADAYADVIGAILPVIDNLERALSFAPADAESESKLASGVEMTLRQFRETMEKLGVTEIEAVDFDPAVHNAVMHVEDEAFGDNKVVEVFQKGYRKGDKIIRHAMVKVAN